MQTGCQSREETIDSNVKWYPYNKGGEYRKWYGNCWYVVDWFNDGEEFNTIMTARENYDLALKTCHIILKRV